MADPPRHPDSKPYTTPRWVKVMAIIAIVAIALGILLLTAGGHGPGRHSGGGGGQQSTGGVGGPADASEAARMVEVTTLDTMTFEPSSISVSAGETVTFVVTNTGQAIHEFTLGDAAMQREHAEAMAHMPARMVHDTPNSITLQPGETGQLTWRFGDAATLEYACHQPDHYEAGVRGQITIT
jgi:uncharacterized cupredoxin-like copper-binding protein